MATSRVISSDGVSIVLPKTIHVWLCRVLRARVLRDKSLIVGNLSEGVGSLLSISTHKSSFADNSRRFWSNLRFFLESFLKFNLYFLSDISNSHNGIQRSHVWSILNNSHLSHSRYWSFVWLSRVSHVPIIVSVLCFCFTMGFFYVSQMSKTHSILL